MDICIIKSGKVVNIISATSLESVEPPDGHSAVAWADGAVMGGTYSERTGKFTPPPQPPQPARQPRPPRPATVALELLKDKGVVTQADIDAKTTELTV